MLNPKAAGQEVARLPQWKLGLEDRRLRAKLIWEETLETLRGLGFSYDLDGGLVELHPFNLVEAVDGCFDLRVVTTGTLSALGVPDLKGQEMVDRNNLAKFGPGCSIREDGKLIKPPGHVAPDIMGLLMRLNHG